MKVELTEKDGITIINFIPTKEEQDEIDAKHEYYKHVPPIYGYKYLTSKR